jgi:integrase
MPKARHTAGQRVLDATNGNLKAVQKLLGHSSISTTGDIYGALRGPGRRNSESSASSDKAPANQKTMRLAGIEPPC